MWLLLLSSQLLCFLLHFDVFLAQAALTLPSHLLVIPAGPIPFVLESAAVEVGSLSFLTPCTLIIVALPFSLDQEGFTGSPFPCFSRVHSLSDLVIDLKVISAGSIEVVVEFVLEEGSNAFLRE
jgi:hypothetical protein